MTAKRRSRPTRRSTPPHAAAHSAAPPAPLAAAQPLAAEALLLELARELSKRAVSNVADVVAIVDATGAAYVPDAPLGLAFRTEWLGTANNKTAQLALAWAREQLRLALVDIVERGREARCVRAAGDADTLAWLWLAACEALAHEPASAVPDRLQAFAAFLTGTPSAGTPAPTDA